jgi:hypothetical protein
MNPTPVTGLGTLTVKAVSAGGPADISFSVGAAAYTLHLTVTYNPDAGPLGAPGPATLDTGAGTLSATLRPNPTSLADFSFTCSTPGGG